jgi:hypothetical protein
MRSKGLILFIVLGTLLLLPARTGAIDAYKQQFLRKFPLSEEPSTQGSDGAWKGTVCINIQGVVPAPAINDSCDYFYDNNNKERNQAKGWVTEVDTVRGEATLQIDEADVSPHRNSHEIVICIQQLIVAKVRETDGLVEKHSFSIAVEDLAKLLEVSSSSTKLQGEIRSRIKDIGSLMKIRGALEKLVSGSSIDACKKGKNVTTRESSLAWRPYEAVKKSLVEPLQDVCDTWDDIENLSKNGQLEDALKLCQRPDMQHFDEVTRKAREILAKIVPKTQIQAPNKPEPVLGSLTVNGTPADADIEVLDGQAAVGGGKMGNAITRLPASRPLKVRVFREKFDSRTLEVSLQSGRTFETNIALRLSPARLVVKAQPQPFQLVVSGPGMSLTNNEGEASNLPAGKTLTVTVSAPECLPVETNLVLEGAEERVLNVGQLPPVAGFIDVSCTPDTARITYQIDSDSPKELPGSGRIQGISIGRQVKVTAQREGYDSETQVAKLQKTTGQSMKFELRKVQPQPASIRVQASPLGAEVAIRNQKEGGVIRGRVNDTFTDQPVGQELAITVSAEGRTPSSTNITLRSGEVRVLNMGNLGLALGWLDVKCSPEDAEITYAIDGAEPQNLSGASRIKDIALGKSVKVRATKSGYVPAENAITISSLEGQSVDLNLELPTQPVAKPDSVEPRIPTINTEVPPASVSSAVDASTALYAELRDKMAQFGVKPSAELQRVWGKLPTAKALGAKGSVDVEQANVIQLKKRFADANLLNPIHEKCFKDLSLSIINSFNGF